MADRERTAALHGVVVATFASRPLAELARAYLDEHGLDALVGADDGNGTQPEVGFVTGGARVVVAPGEVTAARALLASVDPRGPRPARHRPAARWVAAALVGMMVAIGTWASVVVLLF